MNPIEINNSKRISRKEKALRKFGRPIPAKDLKQEMGENYLSYLDEQIKLFSDFQIDSPKFFSFIENKNENENETENEYEQEEIDCPICLNKIKNSEDVSQFHCKHLMHADCLNSYLDSGNCKDLSCPLCRNQFIDMQLR